MIFNLINILNNHSPLLYLTQSLWRDEAFSVLIAEHNLAGIIKLTASDFNPPLYYSILHFWMKLAGESEFAIRMLSFIFHLVLVFVVYKFTKALKLTKFASLFLLFAIFLNPMLIYYAFEARMYSLLALLTTASMYFFFTKNWIFYILSSALGLWTQPFMAFVLVSQGFYLLLTKSLKKEHILSFAAIILIFAPWVPVILSQLSRSGPMWIWPIDRTTVETILGNLFTGYEGTPWGLWQGKMQILSLLILSAAFFTLIKLIISKQRKQPVGRFTILTLIWIFLPVVLVLFVSYFKPIYVNRYSIFVTVAEVLMTVLAITLIRNRVLASVFAIGYLLFIVGFNVWFPPLHRKQDIKASINEILALSKPGDYIFSQTPLTLFEAKYYTPDRSRVFLYNPNLVTVPFYVGQSLIPREDMMTTYPKYPNKAFLIHDDASFEIVYQK